MPLCLFVFLFQMVYVADERRARLPGRRACSLTSSIIDSLRIVWYVIEPLSTDMRTYVCGLE